MAEQQSQWTHDDLRVILERGPIADLERLIADSGRKHRPEFANSYAISALRNIAESDVLPDDIRPLVLRVLELHEKASEPFLGMNLPRWPVGVILTKKYDVPYTHGILTYHPSGSTLAQGATFW